MSSEYNYIPYTNESNIINCYRPKDTGTYNLNNSSLNFATDSCFNDFIDDNEYFTKISNEYVSISNEQAVFNKLDDCMVEAAKDNQDFFFVGDFSLNNYNSNVNINFNCYIPKSNTIFKNSINTMNSILSPITIFLENIFNPPSSGSRIPTLNDYSNLDNLNCFNINNSISDISLAVGRENNYIVYVKKNIPNIRDNITGNLKSVAHYFKNNPYDFSNIKPELGHDYFDYILLDTKNAFSYYIEKDCKLAGATDYKKFDFNDLSNEPIIFESPYQGDGDIQQWNIISRIYKLSEKLMDENDNLSKDNKLLMKIYNLNKYYLSNIDNIIEKKRNKLIKLKKSGNANNAKLYDTKYLKNLKIAEIISLLVIIILSFYISLKKK